MLGELDTSFVGPTLCLREKIRISYKIRHEGSTNAAKHPWLISDGNEGTHIAVRWVHVVAIVANFAFGVADACFVQCVSEPFSQVGFDHIAKQCLNYEYGESDEQRIVRVIRLVCLAGPERIRSRRKGEG